MRCPNCGAEIMPNDMFCINCGANLTQMSSAPSTDPFEDKSNSGPLEQAPPVSRPNEEGPESFTNAPNPNPYPFNRPNPNPYYPVTGGGYGPYPQPQPQKKSNVAVIIIAIVCALLLIAGIAGAVFYFATRDKGNDYLTETRATQQTNDNDSDNDNDNDGVQTTTETTTKPVQETTTKPSNLGLNENNIGSVLSSYNGSTDTSVVIYNLNNGASYKYDENQVRVASAMVIYPIIYTYAQMVDNGEINLNDVINISYDSQGRSKLTRERNGDRMTVDDLLMYSLVYSDNNAINALIKNVGFSRINNACSNRYSSVYMQKYVGVYSELDNYISAEDLAKMIKDMYLEKGTAYAILSNMNSCVNDEYGSKGAYQTSNMVWGFNAFTTGLYHEIGVINGSNGEQYLLVIMSNNDRDYADGIKEALALGGVF